MKQSPGETKPHGQHLSSAQAAIGRVVSTPSFFWLCIFQTTLAVLILTEKVYSFITVDSYPFIWLTPLVYAPAFWGIFTAFRKEERFRFINGITCLQWFYRIVLGLSLLIIVISVLGFVILSTAPVSLYQKELPVFFQSLSPSLLNTLYRFFSILTEGAYYENFIRTMVVSLLVAGMITSTFFAWIYLLILKMLGTLTHYFEGNQSTCYISRVLIVMSYLMAGFSFALSVLSLSPKGFVMLPVFITMACNYFLLGRVLQNLKKTVCTL